jgi:hypothetical protein
VNRDDIEVEKEQLFPALITKNDSNVIQDYTYKSKIKVLSTESMEWIKSVNFDTQDNETISKLHEVLDYYIYPAVMHDTVTDKLCNTQFSQISSSVNTSEIDKEWFNAFRD